MNSRIKRLSDSFLSKATVVSGLDMDYFAKGSFWLLSNQAVAVLKGFVLSILFANVLPKEVFGQYSFVMALIAFASVTALPGMGVGVIQAVARGYDGTYFKALKTVFSWAWLGSLFLLGVAIYVYFVGKTDLILIFLVVASIFPFYASSGYFTNFFSGKKRFDIVTKLTVIFNVVSLLMIASAIYFTKDVLIIVFVTVFIQILLQGYYSFFYVRKFIKSSKVDSKSFLFGKKISLSQAFAVLANRFDDLVVAYFLGFESLAIFKIVTLLPNQIKLVFNSFTPLLLPKMASQNTTKKDLMKHFWKLFVIVILAIVAYVIAAPVIFKWFYPQYAEYVWLSIIYHLSFVVILYILPHNYLMKEKKSSFINLFFSFSSIILIVLSIGLTFIYGLIGAIVARIIYRLFVVLISFYFFSRTTIR